jgi:signal transduction histidine kinase
MGEMASALAHELNQPLSAITNYMKGSRRLLEQTTDERAGVVREAIDSAAEQALRAGQIIRRLRDFVARGESERRVESMAKLVEEASALALVGVKDQGVHVRFQIEPVKRSCSRRQGSDPAGAPEFDTQCHKPCMSHLDAGCLYPRPSRGWNVDDQRRRHRRGSPEIASQLFSHS